MNTNAPSAQRLLTYPLVYLGEVSAEPIQLDQGVFYNLSGLPILLLQDTVETQEENQ